MAWSSPMTFTAGAVLTAAQLNTNLRDNLNMTPPALATAASRIYVSTAANTLAERVPDSASVTTSESTASTSYTNLATFGPQIANLQCGPRALVILQCGLTNATAGATSYAGVAVAPGLASTDSLCVAFESSSANQDIQVCTAFIRSDLTPGLNDFTMQYRVSAGTGSFQNRRISVIPF